MRERGSLLSDCQDLTGECFARKCGRCVILRKGKLSEHCSFKKPEMLVTNGVRYPLNHPSLRLGEAHEKDNT